jgi:hypothetical protein
MDQDRRACAYRSLSADTFAHCQGLFPVEPERPLVVHKVTLAHEQHMKASISKETALMRQRPQRPSRLPCFEIIAP